MLGRILAGLLLSLSSLTTFASTYTDVYTAVSYEAGAQTPSDLTLAGLQSFFQNASLNCTLFAPTDSALQLALSQLGFSAAALAANTGPLKSLLLYHTTLFSQTTADFPPAVNASAVYPTYVTSVNPTLNLTVTNMGGGTYQVSAIGSDALITTADISAGNSTVHVINRLLYSFFTSIYQGLLRLQHARTLMAYANVYAPRLVASLASSKLEYTMFIATETGFNGNFRAFQDFISYTGVQYYMNAHIVPKPLVQISSITTTPITVTTLAGVNLTLVRSADDVVTVASSGGINATVLYTYAVGFTVSGTSQSFIYIVDKPLTPTAAPALLPFAVRADLVNLTKALDADGNYTSVLNGSTAFTGTLLAPTDAAFRAFATAQNTTVGGLLAAANRDALRRLLLLHWINGTVLAAQSMASGQKINTAAGNNTLTVNITGVDITLRATNVSSATVIGNKEYYVGNLSATVLALDAVLVPSGWSLPEPGAVGEVEGGAASAAAPSALATLLSGLLAFAVLQLFSRQ